MNCLGTNFNSRSTSDQVSTLSREISRPGQRHCYLRTAEPLADMRMVALTRDFHVFTSCVTTRLSAVLFSVWHIAKAWYVRALLSHLICHAISSFPVSLTLSDRYSVATHD